MIRKRFKLLSWFAGSKSIPAHVQHVPLITAEEQEIGGCAGCCARQIESQCARMNEANGAHCNEVGVIYKFDTTFLN